MASQANGSCLVRYGDTAVLVNVTMSKEPRDGIDFLQLSVDYEERLYAVGKIPGSFMKREGKPTEKAILTSRLVDRPIRPLFPKDMRNDVSVVMTVLSVDPDCSPEIAGMIATSIAISGDAKSIVHGFLSLVLDGLYSLSLKIGTCECQCFFFVNFSLIKAFIGSEKLLISFLVELLKYVHIFSSEILSKTFSI